MRLTKKAFPQNLVRRQRGAVLLVGLILLAVLILLGVTYAQSAVIQERMSGNFRDQSTAFQSTEAGARWASAWLQNLGGSALARPFPCTAGCDANSRVWLVGNYPSNPTPKEAFWSSARAYGVDPSTDTDLGLSIPDVDAQPKYIMEQQYFRRDDLAGAPQKGVAFYRVTSLGKGQRANSDAVLDSVLAKRFE